MIRTVSLKPKAYHLFENTLRIKNRIVGVGWHRKDPFRHFGPGGVDEAERLCLETGRDLLGYLSVPADVPAERLTVTRRRSAAARHAVLAFGSPAPSGFPENDRVVARLFPARRPRKDAAAIVFHHALFQKSWALWRWFLTPLTDRFPVVMMAAPYHFERTPAGQFAGEGSVNPNPFRLYQSFRQWAWDQKALATAMREGVGLTPVAVMGFSLGAFQTLLTAAAGGIPELPLVSVASTSRYAHGLYEGVLGAGTVDGLTRAGIDRARLERMVEAIQLERYVPRLADRQVLFIAGRHDFVDPPPSGERLEATLRPTRSVWLDVGHATTVLERDRVAREVLGFLESLGLS